MPPHCRGVCVTYDGVEEAIELLMDRVSNGPRVDVVAWAASSGSFLGVIASLPISYRDSI